MDPLSLTANIITVLQVTNSIVSVCYEFKAALKKSPWSLTRILEELKDLRNVLEALEETFPISVEDVPTDDRPRRILEVISCPKTGPLARCLEEVVALERGICHPRALGKAGSRRRAVMQVIGWQFKESETKACLERIQRCKSTLQLAIAADEMTLLADIQGMSAKLNATVQNMGGDVASLLVKLEAKHLEERDKGFTEWLAPASPRETHECALDSYRAGTCNWVFETEPFRKWSQSEGSHLWLSGFPGSGKTILFSHIVTELTSCDSKVLAEEACAAFYYCDFRKRESQDGINVIGSLVAQICGQIGFYPEMLMHAFEHSKTNGPTKRPSFALFQEAIQVLCETRRIVLLIDALDECSGRVDMLDFLTDLGQSTKNLNILVTSRNEQDIAFSLENFTHLRLESRASDVNEDIVSYINHRLNSDTKLQWLNTAIKDEIARSLANGSNGMFRLVQCKLDAIRTLRTIKSIRLAIKDLPHKLGDMYDMILRKITKDDREMVRRILLWLSFTVLPLTLEELRHAIAIEHGQSELDEESLLGSSQDILSMCRSLISVSDEGHVRLAHLSVRDYLLSPDILLSPTSKIFALEDKKANEELALNCLTYLSLEEFRTGPADSSDAFAERITKHPFLRHASAGWSYYLRASKSHDHINAAISDLFSPESRPSFLSWVQVLNADCNFKWDVYPRHATPLYYAACFGLEEVVQALIEQGSNLNASGSRFGGTALHGATIRYHTSVMRLLLEAGADPNRADFNRVAPLHTAATHGVAEVIKLLLQYGASVTQPDKGGEIPLDWARNAGQYESERLMRGLTSNEEKRVVEEIEGRGKVWTSTLSYFPNFYEKRSGMDSSIILKVECGSNTSVAV